MKRVLILMMLGILPASIYAQAVIGETPIVLNDIPSFIVCIIAGVILAFAFQLILTLLSVAGGITAIGNIQKKANEPSSNSSSDSSSSGNMGMKITGAAGVWTIVTASVSLFFASLIAVKLSLIAANFIGVALGLVIWATFFTAMVYMEMKAVTSIIGGIFNTAVSGLRSSFDGVKSIFHKSQEQKMVNVAEESIEEIRKDLVQNLDTSDIEDKIDEWVEKLKPREINYDKVRKEMAQLIDEMRIDIHNGAIDKEMVVKIAEEQPNIKKEDLKKIGNIFEQAQQAAKEGGSPSDKVVKGIDKITPGSEEDARKVRSEITNYLKSTNHQELQPERLREDLNRMINHPESSREIAQQKLNAIDRNTIKNALTAREDIDEQKAEKIVSHAEDALDWVKEKIGMAKDKVNDTQDNIQNRKEQIQDKVTGTESVDNIHKRYKTNENVERSGKDGIEEKVRTRINSINGREFDYDAIKRDFIKAFNNPKHAPEILKERLSKYDKESLIKLISANKNVSREDAERVAMKIEEAKLEAITKAEEIETKVIAKAESLKQSALQQAENSRKIAAAAAWWLVATAVISGFASALGGVLALTI